MCGITGWIDWEINMNDQPKILESMSDTLSCRGPDDSGIWLSTHAGLAHRRLIVIDPQGGKQPMIRDVGGNRFVMIYNGEIYNTEDIRHELKLRGYSFQGHSDTEVLLLSYMEWGSDCLEKLNGIFAFAVWDDAKQQLLMARDRLGVKPLFYTRIGHSLIFGSELKALLAHPKVQPDIDSEGLAEIFAIGPGRTPGHGVFRHVNEVKPGHAVLFDRHHFCEFPYWQLSSAPHEDDLPTTICKIRELLSDAVQRQLVSDVPVGTLLSGGLDSSALSAIAANYYKENGHAALDTFSIDYVHNDRFFKSNEFQPDPDAKWIPIVADFLGSNHHSVYIDTPQLVETLQAAVQFRDLPGMTDIDASLYLFCREIKKKVTVALSGECADEVFGGYPWIHWEHTRKAHTFPWAVKLQERMSVMSRELIDAIQPASYVARRYEEALDEVPRLAGESPEDARTRELYYLNLTRWMPVLLDRKDRMSMAVGLEVRVPFCDHRLVEYVWNIPWEMKRYQGQAKGILRKSLEGMLPPDVLYRKKSPYPKTHNPDYLHATREQMLTVLHDPASPILPFVKVDEIERIAKNAENIHLPWFGQLMNVPQLFAYLVQVNTWMKKYQVQIR